MSIRTGGYVYFVQAEGGGLVKIGRSSAYNLHDRLTALQCGSPVLLTVRHLIETANPAQAAGLEAGFHQRFASARVHGEWFRPTPELVKLANVIPDPDPYARLAVAVLSNGR